MAKLAGYGVDLSPIVLEYDLPAYVLSAPDCPPEILDARRAFLDADARRRPYADALQAVKDEPEDNAIAIRRAVRDGKRPPAPLEPIAHGERVHIATERLHAANREAIAAGNRYEKLIPHHRHELRPIIAAHAPLLAAQAAESGRKAKADHETAQEAITALRSLDYQYMRSKPTGGERERLDYAFAVHYQRVDRADAYNEIGRPRRMMLAWDDVLSVTAGVPADVAIEDPYADQPGERADR
jgi:hypothetical protein